MVFVVVVFVTNTLGLMVLSFAYGSHYCGQGILSLVRLLEELGPRRFCFESRQTMSIDNLRKTQTIKATLLVQGTLTFVRVYSGALETGTFVSNPNKGKKERIGRIQLMHANNREDIKVNVLPLVCLWWKHSVA